MDKLKILSEDMGDEKMKIIFYYLEKIIFDEMLSRKLVADGDFRVADPMFYEKEQKEYKLKRKKIFNDLDNVKLLNICSDIRVYIKNLDKKTTRSEFVKLITSLEM